MKYQKGHPNSNTPEGIKKISLALKGRMPKNIKSIAGWNKGKPMSEATKEKLRQINLGKKQSAETRLKRSIALSGNKNPNWIEDKTKLKVSDKHNNARYVHWMKSVIARDKGLCRMANKDCCGILEIHHILSFRKYPELRYELNNGITLCHFHHPRKWKDEEKHIPILQSIIAN